MKRILITGSNRGIGLELVRHFLRDDDTRIFATCRNPDRAEQLQKLSKQNAARLRLLQLDINDASSIDAAAKVVAAQIDGLDVLINNAGIYPKGSHQSWSIGKLSAADLGELLLTNSVGPLMVTQAFQGLLLNGENPRVLMISSGMGSISGASVGSYGYRMSKAALNMAARVLAMDGDMRGITTITTHPGWVQTDMGGPAAQLTPAESAAALKTLIGRITPADSGRFLRWDGIELDW